MNVLVSVKGRFHAFYLSEQIQNTGNLNKLITTYPKYETVKYGVDASKIKSLVVHEIIERALRSLPNKIKSRMDYQFFLRELFDRHVARNIQSDVDLFVGWSSNSLHSIRKAKQKGIITIVERGSSHIEYQNQILKDEYDIHGIPYKGIPRKIIEKEIKEYNEADYICVPSSYVRRTFLEKDIKEDKIMQISYGVNLTHFYKVPKNDDTFRVVFCGAISLRKGVQYLLQAFTELNLPNSELILIGAIQEEMKIFMKKFKNDKIVFKGSLPEKELYKYYSQGSVFCLPSIEEGLAMVQVQAMACGLPLICTTNTGGEDLIEEGKQGFVGQIRDIEFLKEKILLCYENKELLEYMSQEAIKRVSEGHTWNHYGDNILRHYQEILNNK